jgi:hypothetical protein
VGRPVAPTGQHRRTVAAGRVAHHIPVGLARRGADRTKRQ